MLNLDQLRAANALPAAKGIDRSSIAKLPAMILTNGLLAALAFACEKDKTARADLRAAADAIAKHLAHSKFSLTSLANCTTGSDLGARLARGDALSLQRATTESLAFLSYLKRFADKKPKPASAASKP